MESISKSHTKESTRGMIEKLIESKYAFPFCKVVLYCYERFKLGKINVNFIDD